jgi:hypothetical protein
MKKSSKILILSILSLVLSTGANSQVVRKNAVIRWKGVQSIQGIDYQSIQALSADGVSNDPSRNYSPLYSENVMLPKGASECGILVTHTEWEAVPASELQQVSMPLVADETLTPVLNMAVQRGIPTALITLNPLVLNPGGGMMRLKSFQLEITYQTSAAKTPDAGSAYAQHSVLAQGNWYKIRLKQTGIYKITYADMQAMGITMNTVTPDNIRLFGNGGGVLPESNSVFRYDDLAENAIQVVTAIPGVFAPGDYILFYGTSPDKTVYNKMTKKFEHVKNIYSDYAYYFLNFESGQGLRISDRASSGLTPTYTSVSYQEGVFYENDLLNLITSGKDWVGERMDPNNPLFQLPVFNFQNINPGKQAWVRYRVTAKSNAITNFNVMVNGDTVSSPSLSAFGNYNFATEKIETRSFYPQNGTVNVAFRYNGTGASIGWLDWVELNISHELKFNGGQMQFADPISVADGRVTEFQLQQSSQAVSIWEVTDPVHVKRIAAELQGSMSRFVCPTDSIRQFVAWDNTSFLTTEFVEKMINQDLHGMAASDMLIVTPPEFMDQANRLAQHHLIRDGLRVAVVTNQQIYNEFSSGSPDICAIRDFARMLYARPAEGDKLRYLLLFGDGSFDFKDRVPGNTNKVLTFQTRESLNSVSSYATDDFFGLLDAGEGADAVGLIDIGIGRFPVSTPEQAAVAVDKCIFYSTNSAENMGDWRNKLCFVADDGNGNTHFGQVEKQICPLVESLAPVYNVNKVYVDGYKQISIPTGQRCPDANNAITTNVENGVLVLNYTGHGGETGWADEGILTVREIDAWSNYRNMPVFMTATCEFSRFDDPGRVSAGEHVFLNPNGGGVALFTTTRLANAGTNIGLTLYFYDTLFAKFNGEYPRFGDVIAHAKNKIGNKEAALIRNFVLLGDPALQLAYPKYNVATTEINGQSTEFFSDTISAMEPVSVKGMVIDDSGVKVSSFSGILDVKVFDKERTLMTLGSEPGDWPDEYKVRDNYIYQGLATVTNGDFQFSFIVPRDIDYSYGPGKISYYTHSDVTDAQGYSNQIIIGGSGDESADVTGPEIQLFMDGENFTDGGVTGPTPTLIANLSDISGINTISNAIGHDIVATIDGDNSSSVVLNSFYTADLDSYQSGTVQYKFPTLSEGSHTLSLKAWDVFNNSSVAQISFVVSGNMQITITDVNITPNPFTDQIRVGFSVNLFNSPVEAWLEVFNMNGSLISSTSAKNQLVQGYDAGYLTWDGTMAAGGEAPAGAYLVCVRASNGKSETVKAVRVVKFR